MDLQGRWRLIFTTPEEGLIIVMEVSNHYDD